MAEPENGQPRWRPTVPTMLVVASVVVALVAVSTLIVVLFQQTEGPGEVLRDFARRLEAGDCPGSYALLDDAVQRELPQERWCQEATRLSDQLGPGFEIERVVLEGQGARVEVAGPETTTGAWFLTRHDRSWLVKGAGAAIDFPA